MSCDNPTDGDYSWADAPLQQPQPQHPAPFSTGTPSAPTSWNVPFGYTSSVPNYPSPLPLRPELEGSPLPNWRATQSHVRSVSAVEVEGSYPPGRYPPPHIHTNMTTCPSELPAHVPVQYQYQQQQQSYNHNYLPFGNSPVSPGYDSTPIPIPMSAPPVVSNNPFSNNPFASELSSEHPSTSMQQQVTAIETQNHHKRSMYDDVQEVNPDSTTELPADLELGAKEKSLDSYEMLDVYWDQQFSALITTVPDTIKEEKAERKKKKKGVPTDVKAAYFFESRPFGSTKAKNDGGDVQLFACRSSSACSSPAAESLEGNLNRPKSKKGSNGADWKGDILGCVRYHTANWKGNWKMHVCMGKPDSESAHFEWMTQSGIIKEQWMLTGYTFRYTTSPGPNNSVVDDERGKEIVCRNIRISGTTSAIPGDVKRSSRFGNLKMQDADTETTLAVYLNHGMSASKRGRIMLRKGLENAFRDFAVLVLLGVDERRQRDIRNSSYCASGWWVHMMMRGVSRDEKVKGVKQGL